MTRKSFGELAISILEKGYVTSDKRPDIREVWVAMDIIRQSEINRMLVSDEGLGSEWITTYPEVTVLTDTVRNLKYSNLPAGILSTNGNGVWQVSPTQNENIHLIQISSGDEFLTSGLPSHNVLGMGKYWREGAKLFYKNNPYTKVLIKMIPIMADVPDNFPIPFPDYEYAMDKLLQWFGLQQTELKTP